LERLIDEQQANLPASTQHAKPGDSPKPRPGQATTGDPASDPAGAQSRQPTPAAHTATDEEVSQSAQGVWGILPDRIRQQIHQLAQEEFLPEFADLIREYYQRLAERASKQP
jgi:hypothetical protein